MSEHGPAVTVIEDGGPEDFLVRGRQDGEPVDVRLHVEPVSLSRWGLGHIAPREVVDVTMAYLLGHQRLDELPPLVDLEEVAAAYDGFEAHLLERLGGRH